MTILLVRIDHPPGGEHLAIRGFSVDRANGDWTEELRAETLLPREQPLFTSARQAVLTTGDSPLSAPDAGLALWHLIADGDVGVWWRQAAQTMGPTTTRTILDVRVPDLQKVPWELMAADGRTPVFRNEHHPWVRAQTPWQSLAEMPVPVKVLVVVGESHSADLDVSDSRSADLDVDEELAAVFAALRTMPARWNVDVLSAPNLTQLRRTLAEVQPDVLHIIAHGMKKGNEQVLAFTDAAGAQWDLTRQDVDAFPTPMPRLVLLNACRTATAAEGQSSSWSFTDSFTARGVAAVVAMQGDIPSTAAAEFSRTFYAHLADGVAVDVATTLARQAVYEVLKVQGDARSWALPFLSVAADPDRVLPVSVSVEDEQLIARLPFSEAFAPVCSYVDRAAERRQLWDTLDPPPDRPGSSLVLVAGPKQVGKSAVVLSVLMTLRLRGRNVVYVDLSPRPGHAKPASWLTVLRRIRDAISYWVPEGDVEARQRFDHELSAFKRYQDPLPWTSESGQPDDGAEFESVGDQFHDWVERIFASFHRMLAAVAADAPMLLALDGLSGVYEPDLTRWLSPNLLEPLARPDPPGSAAAKLRGVVVVDDAQLPMLTEETRRLAGTVQRVNLFTYAELPRLAREYYAREDVPIAGAEWWPGVWALLKSAPPTGWHANQLKLVLNTSKAWT